MSQSISAKIAELIEAEKETILDQYFSKLRLYFHPADHSKAMPEWVVVLLRTRFADVLERQISYLRTGQYDNSASLEDKSYAIRVIPFCSQELKSKRLILTMELFTGTVTEHIFNKLKVVNSISCDQIAPLLDKLAYLAYEDLWITTIVSHRLQRNIIQKLHRETIKAHDNERRDLSLVLHDGVLQSLAAALVQTQILEKMITGRHEKKGLTRELLHLRKIITDTIQKTRDINYAIYPRSLREEGLMAALQTYSEGFQRETGIAVDISSPDAVDETLWGNDAQTNIYRIIQELMTNIRKHANAKRVRIEISTERRRFYLIVADDGIGFDLPRMLANLTRSPTFGLLSVREQTTGCKGTMHIQTSPGQGTRIEIEIPPDDRKI